MLLLIGVVALAAPASALAQGQVVPPGNSEADQYSESVPGADGNHVPDGDRPPDKVLDEDQVDDLESLGPDGAAAAAAAAATAPSPGIGRPRANEAANGPDAGSLPGAGEDQGAGGGSGDTETSTAGVAAPGDGMGAVLWAILIATAAGALVYVLARWWAGRRT